MAANTRYQPVYTDERSSLEEQNYTQQPPSYQAEPSLGQARSEDDNVPDDFKFGGSVAEATLPIRMQFVRKVYSVSTPISPHALYRSLPLPLLTSLSSRF